MFSSGSALQIVISKPITMRGVVNRDNPAVEDLSPAGGLTSRGCLLLIGLAWAGAAKADAQISYPMVMSLKPVAIQAGTTSECEVQSRYSMRGTYQVLVSGTGVKAEVIPPEEPADPPKPGEKLKDLTKLKLKFDVAAEALPGVREFRLATPQGASTLGQLVVVRDPVVAEATDNNTAEKAQVVALPATICGAIEKVEDFDFYKFTAAAGQSLSFQVRCQRLQDKIHDLQAHADPILFLRDLQGTVLAVSDNSFFADPFLTYTFEQAGEYLLELRDVRYHGNVSWEYCIEAHSRPYVTGAFPKALRAGVETTVELSGVFLSGASTPVNVPEGTPTGAIDFPLVLNGGPSNPAPFLITDLPTAIESQTDNNDVATAQELDVPVVISGRIETEADLDCFSFSARKGDKFTFEILARRQFSNLDSFLRILNDKGQPLREDDDGRFGRLTSADTFLEGWEAPADGTFFVEVRDQHLRGGPGFEYVLQITRSVAYFELQLDTDKTLLSPGLSGAIFARVVRKQGFVGEVQLHVSGLPPGVTATCGRILAGKSQDGCIVLTAADDAAMLISELQVTGTATQPQGNGLPDLQLSATAVPYQEYYSPGGGRGHYPVQSHVVSVSPAADILSIQLSETEIVLKPGESRQLAVTLQRNKDANQNVTLDMLYKHLDSVFANSLPEGVTIDGGQSKTLLTASASEGIITLKADNSAPPAERQVGVVMANFAINFVMKATYCSPPVFVTVKQSTP